MQNNQSQKLDEAINIVLDAAAQLDGDRVDVARRVIRALYLHTGCDAEAIVYGTSAALFEHDDDLADILESNMFDVLMLRLDKMN